MCFCCCTTRFSILIYMIVISSLAFIYGIVAIAKFGSSTEIYKYLIQKIEKLEQQPKNYTSNSKSNSNSNGYSNPYGYNDPYDYGYLLSKDNLNKTRNEKNLRRNAYNSYNSYNSYNAYGIDYNTAKLILDSASQTKIDYLTQDTLEMRSYGLIKSLKGIENGIGVVLFIFPLIFLIIEIVLTIFTCGNKEFTVLSPGVYNTFNVIQIISITLSIIFIFLSILYGILLIVTVVEYMALVNILDSCAIGMIFGIVYGYYGFYYYIVLSCAFCAVRQKFTLVGNSEKPGPDAKFDLNGNQIVPGIAQTVTIPQTIQVQPQPQTILYPQNTQNNTQNFTYSPNNMIQPQNQIINMNHHNYVQSQTNLNSLDEFITINGITYRRWDGDKTNPVNEIMTIKTNEPNLENKVVQ